MNGGGEDEIVNVVEPFRPKAPLLSWIDFEKEFKKYMEKKNLKFRVRSSERTASYNTYACFTGVICLNIFMKRNALILF